MNHNSILEPDKIIIKQIIFPYKFQIDFAFWARDLKQSGKYGSKLSLGLIFGLSFRIQSAFYFPQSWVQKTGLIFYLADFHGRNWRILGFSENKLNIEPYSPLKLTEVGFIFIGPNSLCRAEDLAELGRRLGLNAWFKELRPESKVFKSRATNCPPILFNITINI